MAVLLEDELHDSTGSVVLGWNEVKIHDFNYTGSILTVSALLEISENLQHFYVTRVT